MNGGRAGQDAAPSPPDGAVDARARSSPSGARRRCFICLMDQDPSDPPDSWVDPCPCTLEGHQDCVLSWITDCERSNKPLLCPICKAPIELDEPWDPIAAIHYGLHRRFTRLSPFILFTGVSIGIQFSLQMYGALALWTFAGKGALMRFILGPEMMNARGHVGMWAIKGRIWNALILMNVAPVLLFAKFMPSLSHRFFLPTASLVRFSLFAPSTTHIRLFSFIASLSFLSVPSQGWIRALTVLCTSCTQYTMYNLTKEDNFLTWPPSPQLAMAVFPYMRAIYLELWKEFALPYENRMNRQLIGLPAEDTIHAEGENGAGNLANNQVEDEVGLLGLLQNLGEVLDADEENDNPGPEVQDGGGGEPEPREGLQEEAMANEAWPARNVEDFRFLLMNEDAENEGGFPFAENLEALRMLEMGEAEARAADGDGEWPEWPAEGWADVGQERRRHEAPVAPVRRIGLGIILSSLSNAVVGALIMPAVSLVMGEALRLLLPQAWTSPVPHQGQYSTRWGQGTTGRPGLLQQKWGRSLVGGCLFVVLKDVVRVYSKSRKLAALSRRRVKNVTRKRGGGS